MQKSSVDYTSQYPKEFLLPHKLQVLMIFKIVVILEFLQLQLGFVDILKSECSSTTSEIYKQN